MICTIVRDLDSLIILFKLLKRVAMYRQPKDPSPPLCNLSCEQLLVLSIRFQYIYFEK